jgi:hypothetical protein
MEISMLSSDLRDGVLEVREVANDTEYRFEEIDPI